eukprot:TRINITY_DN289_c0_g2_i4.p1 TRINITY_DN289_c0_g2~~TRINITY_DN289_c0_g2_i4.p1  ORF type:complete len:481 (+),score=226.56 TRINITY_DN289_c0_g2_i4:122-1564(+)
MQNAIVILIVKVVNNNNYNNNNSGFRKGFDFNSNSSGQFINQSIDFNKKLTPFERNIYKVNANVSQLSEKEVASYRQIKNIVIRKGSDKIPKPIRSFSELNLPEQLKKILDTYSEPMPIQSQTWPILLEGSDLVGLAETGSGKTLGYVIPAIAHVFERKIKDRPTPSTPRVLILAPTRELVNQILQEVNRFGPALGVFAAVAYGGQSRIPQINALTRADIAICTPGRLIDLCNNANVSLNDVSMLILDEADMMLDMGFEPQVRSIISITRQDRITSMFTATWPKEIIQLAEEFMNNYFLISVGGAGEQLVANRNIKQNFHNIPEMQKFSTLVSFVQKQLKINSTCRVLIFVNSKANANYLEFNLSSLFSIGVLHGDKTQERREAVIGAFKRGDIRVVVATDVAARGLDIKDVSCVINYDTPASAEQYIHRIGRTARAGANGVSETFISERDSRIIPSLLKVLQQSNQLPDPVLLSLSRRY